MQVTNAAGHVTKYDVYGFKNAANSLVAVDGFQKQPGLLKQVTDPNNVVTKYEYDPFGKLCGL
ncbi:MAG: RHS repeat domain-containing protein [Chloroflexota bacterium]